jgi:hypothetical protein
MTILEYLERSAATDSFRAALADFVRTGRSGDTIRFGYGCPPVKVERTITKVLEEYPGFPLESIEVDGASGCEFFRGTAILRGAGEERRVRFWWDCKWRAQQEGWTDWFGFPDQTRAAREFGHDCFRQFAEEPALETA